MPLGLRKWMLAGALLGATLSPAGATDAIDPALVGTWDGTGKVVTSAMAKTGAFILRVDAGGFYLQIFRGMDDFVVDWGPFTTVGATYKRKASTGLEDQGSFARKGNGFAFQGIWSDFTLTPAADKREALFTRLMTLMRAKPGTAVSDWAMRAAELAALWQPDAGLDSITFGKPGSDGRIGPDSSLSLAFYSRGLDQILTMAPTKNGGLVSFVSARQGRAVGPRPIPVPIADPRLLFDAARAAGHKDRHTNATLRFFGDTPDKARVLWIATPESGSGWTRRCLDVAADKLTDCRPLAGDPIADFNALAKRAAEVQQRLHQQWSAGSVGPDFSMPSIHDRCAAMGATVGADSGCTGSGGTNFKPP